MQRKIIGHSVTAISDVLCMIQQINVQCKSKDQTLTDHPSVLSQSQTLHMLGQDSTAPCGCLSAAFDSLTDAILHLF